MADEADPPSLLARSGLSVVFCPLLPLCFIHGLEGVMHCCLAKFICPVPQARGMWCVGREGIMLASPGQVTSFQV